MPINREIAYKVKIENVLKNQYVVNSESETNYFLIGNKKVSRVNIIAFITSIENNTLSIDDGSGEIILRDFNNIINSELDSGNMILIIGRPREYNGEKYIVPEIIKKIENQTWMKLRQLELKDNDNEPEKIEIVEEKEFVVKKSDGETLNDIKDIITLNDKGDGVPMKIILEKYNNENGEEEIKKLLKMGEIYEIKPSVFKIL